jgi:hypothetical protein
MYPNPDIGPYHNKSCGIQVYPNSKNPYIFVELGLSF